MAKFIVGSRNDQTGGYSVSSAPKIHTIKSTAQSEAIRLASLSPGKEYVVLELVSAHKVQAVTTVPV